MNIVLIVVDSLRAQSLRCADTGASHAPLFDRLDAESVCFRRAYATECWTLPAHLSMFTGLLPSEHGAHFQGMSYQGAQPTIAELLAGAGHRTEIVTRNPQFDGTAPGVTRGFATNTRLMGSAGAAELPVAMAFAWQKPRLRRMIATGGWYSLLQRENAEFLSAMARIALPADQLVLNHLLDRMADYKHRNQRFFLFANLFDVHSPYGGNASSFFSSIKTMDGWRENLAMRDLCRIQSHDYLRPGFEIAEWSRKALLRRYHRGIEFMSEKLAAFFDGVRAMGLLDDTMIIVTADHGEAFGEHGLFYHDASVYNVHLHVPLWIIHPDLAPTIVNETVSIRDLFFLMLQVGRGNGVRGTVLDPGARAPRAAALSEHFHYPRMAEIIPKYAQNIASTIVGHRKIIVRREGLQYFNLAKDPEEIRPAEGLITEFEEACRRDGASTAAIRMALDHLRRWEISAAAA